MTQVMVYTLPILMYMLSLVAKPYPIKAAWAVVSCLQVLDRFTKISHFVSCVLIAGLFFLPDFVQYEVLIGDKMFSANETYNLLISTFVIILVLLNVYSNPHPAYKQTPTVDLSQSTKRLGFRRHLQ